MDFDTNQIHKQLEFPQEIRQESIRTTARCETLSQEIDETLLNKFYAKFVEEYPNILELPPDDIINNVGHSGKLRN